MGELISTTLLRFSSRTIIMLNDLYDSDTVNAEDQAHTRGIYYYGILRYLILKLGLLDRMAIGREYLIWAWVDGTTYPVRMALANADNIDYIEAEIDMIYAVSSMHFKYGDNSPGIYPKYVCPAIYRTFSGPYYKKYENVFKFGKPELIGPERIIPSTLAALDAALTPSDRLYNLREAQLERSMKHVTYPTVCNF